MQTMKAIISTGYGGPEVLVLKEVKKPTPKDNEILIRIYAASVTRAGTMMRTGKPYFGRLFTGLSKPKHPIPGTGFAGVVESIGSAVTRFKAGDRVFGESIEIFGTQAEYIALPEDGLVMHKPAGMTCEEGASVCDGPLTSINFLKDIAHIQPGQKVLINGASGALGTSAVQLAKHYGAQVTGVCSTKNIDLVNSLGADHVIDYTKVDFTKGDARYDIIYDTVGTLSFPRSKRALSENGLFISPVLKFSLLLQVLWSSFFGKKKAKFAATGLKPKEELRTLLEELTEIIASGKLKSVTDRVYPLSEISEAHQYIDTGHKRGNVVVITGQRA